jgi:hypothetical protein
LAKVPSDRELSESVLFTKARLEIWSVVAEIGGWRNVNV